MMLLSMLAAQAAAVSPAHGAAPAPAAKAPSEIVATAPAAAWRDIPADELLVMTLANGAEVTIRLAPDWAPRHVANIRALAEGGWWDGTSINRVQDNYVVQWGDASEAKKLPATVTATPPAEYERALRGVALRPLPVRDAYATRVGHAGGWPVASDGSAAWIPHCYAMVGVGRNVAPDTGSGAELYTVIGHAPRHLDRNIAVVGVVLSGIEALSSLPRGIAALGFYDNPAQRVAITRVRLGRDISPPPTWQYLDEKSAAFAAYADARANRHDVFFNRPAGGADICNVPVPVRRRP
jgi:peptidylprolyl isomerase